MMEAYSRSVTSQVHTNACKAAVANAWFLRPFNDRLQPLSLSSTILACEVTHVQSSFLVVL